jgi:glucose/arabinose dehydrogenase
VIPLKRPARTIGLALACSLAILAPAAAATLPAGFAEVVVASGLRRPTAMAFAPDGRLFVCEQGGTLRVVKNSALLATPFLTVTVNSSGERGLLGVAFDPAFATNGFVYIYYTATTPTVHNRVSRFTAVGDVASAGSEVPILDLETLGATNHIGGAIHFGNDGKLFVAVGENAVGANAQNLGTRLGKILRINTDGTIPSDNPFFTTATGANRAIWALGLRNPYTFAFEPVSGRMLINDVGERTWEEVNEGLRGANYGWPNSEGPTTAQGETAPLYAYDHGAGCAISGGAFHNLKRPQFPHQYWGTYFIGDYCSGWIRSITLGNGTFTQFASGISGLVDLASASDGSLYYLARGGGTDTGIVSRISYTVTTPRVDLTANGSDGPITVTPGTPLQILASFDAGPAGSINAFVFVGIFSPGGTLFADSNGTFGPTPTPAFAGAVSSFQSMSFANIPNPTAVLQPGPYWWFMLILPTANPNASYSDMVLTSVP